ncbi:MAG: glycosyltransferase family 39 protein [Candidatus Parvarchaeota archaeon]|nr:glycosyltransferase family 39 protein [Candidatus Jingweiarchaeum tengchongense]MCW1298423.1 glycosyltransferase family 39 protein [Candidatus Jingweiarchaeum tengchongense]MCW1310833.1 glycosyltransferase family 39 protein [Candidatus Jingweiarchaeum tengchongense]
MKKQLFKLIEKYHLIFALFTYIILTILFTWPLILNLEKVVAQSYNYILRYEVPNDFFKVYASDSIVHISYIWFFKQSLLNLTDPHFTNYMFVGIYDPFNFAYSPLSYLQSFIGAIFTILTNDPIIGFNLVSILTFILCGFFMYYLIFNLTKNKTAALFSGIFYAFNTLRMRNFVVGSFNPLGNYFIPLIFLFFWKIFRKGRYKDAILAGFFFSLQVMSDLQYTYFTATFLIFYFIFEIFIQRNINKKILKCLGLSLLAALPITIYVIYPILPLHIQGKIAHFAYSDTMLIAPALSNFFIKKPCLFVNPNEFGNCVPFEYISIVILVLASTIIFFKKNNFIYFLIFCSLFFFTLTLGSFTGEPLLKPFADFSPYKLFWNLIPGFSLLRMPQRWGMLTYLCLCCLASFSYTEIIKRVKKKYHSFLNLLVISLVIIDLAIFPLPIFELDTSYPAYIWLKNQSGDFVILEYPLFLHAHSINQNYMFYITVHQKRTVNGYSDIATHEYERIYPIFNNIVSNEAVKLLKKFGVRYILVHPYLTNFTSESEMRGYDNVINFLNLLNKNKNVIQTEEPSIVFELVKNFNDTLVYEIKTYI